MQVTFLGITRGILLLLDLNILQRVLYSQLSHRCAAYLPIRCDYQGRELGQRDHVAGS